MKYLNLDSEISEIQSFLLEKNWLHSNAEMVLEIEKPGEGNMNVVLRVKTNQRSFILKQSRPFVQKYQQIEAPLDRIKVEYLFYKTIEGADTKEYVPNMIAYDPSEYLLMMEDLGHCEDLTTIYENRSIVKSEVIKLVEILYAIHQKENLEDYPENLELRKLNHQHMFVLPFMMDNGFQLDDIQKGLQTLALSYKKDEKLKTVINQLGAQYLTEGTVLLHGDYYPGSWMKAGEQIYILDPEFSFVGYAEFDLGVMAAHLVMGTMDRSFVGRIIESYEGQVNEKLVYQITGVEIMRRLIGLAQLSLERTLEEKAFLLESAKEMILS